MEKSLLLELERKARLKEIQVDLRKIKGSLEKLECYPADLKNIRMLIWKNL
jgi:hypothetical protein